MTSRRKYLHLALSLTAAACAWWVCGIDGRATAAPQKGARPARTQGLFKQHCAKCHGLDGRGRTLMGDLMGAPNFTDAAWQEGATDRRFVTSVRHGRGGMPSFKEKLSAAEAAALVAYVRRFKD